ncbi:hypothetical protein D1BOALGB6SA_3672 [Olavius sp. associated proteobacterium Delta 1]|nr:hypothetical protein D1BOALGB6SA_3672 [Olavius sp. associated proteobacterium Delta 1]
MLKTDFSVGIQQVLVTGIAYNTLSSAIDFTTNYLTFI